MEPHVGNNGHGGPPSRYTLSLLENNNYDVAAAETDEFIFIKGKPVPLRVQRDKVPSIMWEPAILSGYRPVHQPWSYYLNSLFWVHNETVNVWTHLVAPYIIIALVYILAKDINYFTDRSSHGLLLFVVASFVVFACSASAHLLSNRSIRAHNVLFSFDYLGVAMYIYGHGIMLYYCSGNELFYTEMASFYPFVHGVLCCNLTLWNVIGLKYRDSKSRKVMQVVVSALPLAFCQITLLFRLYTCIKESNCFDNPNHFQIYPACLALLNGALFSCHQPERCYPGKFDIWGHGHQWFHLAVILAAISKLYACHIDLLRIPRKVLEMAKPDITYIWTSFVIVTIINLTIVLLFCFLHVRKLEKRSDFVTEKAEHEIQSFV